MIKIGIVDDHAIVRAGLKQFLSEQVDLRVEGEAGNGREAIDLVRTTELDVLIMDLAMPGQSGLDALAMIRAKAPDLGILILSGYPEEQYAINLIRQGASGYLNKECDPAEIVDAVRTIALAELARRSATCPGRTSCRASARCRAWRCWRAAAGSSVRAGGAGPGSSQQGLCHGSTSRASAGALLLVSLDFIDAIEHAATELEEHGAGAEHPPAFEGFLRQAPAGGELSRREQYGWCLDVHGDFSDLFGLPSMSLGGAL